MAYRVDTLSRISNVRRTPQGGLDIPANLTRTGVFIYHNQDGSEFRELRPAAEVFDGESLDTLRGATLTVGHPGVVRSDNWRELSVGHIGDDVKPAGQFVAARVRVQDSDAVGMVERKELVELSCGYTCDLDPTPGVFEGERYDAIQKNIRYNHVALGPPGWGRAGGEVRLRMDGQENAAWSIPYASSMTLEEALKEIERLKGENAGLQSRADAADKALATAKQLDIDALVQDRVNLVQDAQVVLGADAQLTGKSRAAVVREVATKVHPDLVRADSTEAFLEGLFAAAVKSSRKDAAEKNVAAGQLTVDGGSVEDQIAAARKRNEERSRNAWKGN